MKIKFSSIYEGFWGRDENAFNEGRPTANDPWPMADMKTFLSLLSVIFTSCWSTYNEGKIAYEGKMEEMW